MTRTKAVHFTGPRAVEVRDIDLGEPGPGDVLVETLASGISAGTEMNVYRGLAPQWRKRRDAQTGLFMPSDKPEWSYPTPYGYACVGRVINGTESLAAGTLVFTYTPHASHSIVRADAAFPIGERTSPEVGVLFSNLNTALNGVLDARPPIGSHVVVVGLGVIGQLAVRLLAQSGMASVIAVDKIVARRDLAVAGGATHVLDPTAGPVAEAVRAIAPAGADIVLEVSGEPAALNEAIRIVGRNGLVVALSWYGNDLSAVNLAGEFHHNRVQIRSSQVGALDPALGPLWTVARRMALARDYLGTLDLAPLISHRIPVEQAPEAYAMLDNAPQDAMQVVFTYGSA